MNIAFARALALFDEVVALAPAQRVERLATLAREEPAAHDALLRLLATDDSVDDDAHALDGLQDVVFADTGASVADPHLGTRLGPWRIEAVIDSGGMGTVYEAWRDDGQYRQRVALKCMRHELSSPRLVESFLRERETLAALDHPGIAALMDGGIDGAGRPWFAMRYVDGQPIDAWCRAHRAGIEQRVDLLIQACEALAYAHARLVLHQDIKPANLLVTPDGQVQLLDFGLTASLAADALVPRIAISEGYAPPEATRGDRPTLASDIWSLGMVMYRLLCERLPATASRWWLMDPSTAPASAPMSQLAAELPETEAHARGARNTRTLSRRLGGDLDAIALRCIAVDPADRYASAIALRDDLLAWRRHRPVQARGGGALYRSGRFLVRHRLAVGLAGLAALALVTGGGVAAWQADRVAREAAATVALSQVFEQTLGVATLSGLGETGLSSRALLEDTERRVREVAGDGHPAVLARGLAILARSYTVLGDYRHATALAREAASLRGGDPPARAAHQATLAALLNLQGKPADANRVVRGVLEGPGADDIAIDVLVSLRTELARSEWLLADHADAQRTLEATLSLAQRHETSIPVAVAELKLLRGQWRIQQFRFAEARADFEQVIAATQHTHPLIANQARHHAAAGLVSEERVGDGLALAEAMLSTQRATLGDDHPLTGQALITLASLQCSAGKAADCAASLDRAEPLVLRYLGDGHPEYARLLQIRSLLSPLGNLISQEEGIVLLRRAVAINEANYPPDHEWILSLKMMLARRLVIMGNRAAHRTPQPRSSEAISLLEQSIAKWERSALPVQPLVRISLAQAYGQRNAEGDQERARAQLEKNRQTLRLLDPRAFSRFHNTLLLAQLDARAGDLERASVALEEAIPALQEADASINIRIVLVQAMMLRAAIAQRAGDLPLAADWLSRAQVQAEISLRPGSELSKMAQEQRRSLEQTGRFSSQLD